MTVSDLKFPLIVITGPTASGKTSLAIELAKKFNGEIICADSRTVYKDMNIGTAKPSAIDCADVPHFGLDLVNPGEYYSVSDFKLYADQKIKEIRSRGHIPFLVGGTGLYIDAVVFNYKFGPPANVELRSQLQHKTLDELYEYCDKYNIKLPENYKNKRYVIRSIENNGTKLSRREKPIDGAIVVGIATERLILRRRIEQRIEQLFDNGVVDEAKMLGDKYGWDNEAMKSNIYPLVNLYLNGIATLDEIKNKCITLDYQLAKRQMTWMKRNKFIHWVSIDDANKYLSDNLAIYL